MGLLASVLASACDRAGPHGAAAAGPARRVVSLSPAISATLVALGHADRVAGRTPWCGGLPQVPVVGTSMDVDLERMVAIDPDLIVIQRTSRGTLPELERVARVRGWRIETLPCDSLQDLSGLGDRLQTLCGPGPQGASLAARWQAVLRPPAAFKPQERVAFLLPGPGVRAFGQGSYLVDLWKVWGGRCWPEAQGWPEVQIEDLVVARPDRVIVVGGQPSPELNRMLESDQVQVESLADPRLLQPGPDFLVAAETWRASMERQP